MLLQNIFTSSEWYQTQKQQKLILQIAKEQLVQELVCNKDNA